MARLGAFSKTVVLIFLFALVVLLQFEYDAAAKSAAAAPATLPNALSPELIRLTDFGFHAAFGAAFWVPTMPEVLDLFRGRTEYFQDLDFVNGIDGKFAYPYAFSVLILPATPYKDADAASFRIGQEGLAKADPDWRIPYYMAINYYLDLKDRKDALTYFDLAARTPGIPQFAERFSLNFGIGSNERATTEELWTTIRDSASDEFTKERAQAYIDRLQDFDYLEAAAKIYKQKFGAYPASPQDLVAKDIIPAVPVDPFGFTFTINASSGTAGIDLSAEALPSYIQKAPVE